MHDTLFTSTVQHFADVGSHIGIMIAKRSFPAATLPTKRQLKKFKVIIHVTFGTITDDHDQTMKQ